MLNTVKFTLMANTIALLFGALLYWFIPFIQAMKIIDLAFLTGCCFWIASTISRLGSQRFKKNPQKSEATLTDPTLIMRSNNLAFNFLMAGLPGILGSIIAGTFLY